MTGTHLSFPLSSPFGSGFSFVPGPGGTSLAALGPTPAGDLAGRLDMLIDPATLDFVRTANGEWAETADSRTKMLLMMELELGASPFTPADGTRIAEFRRLGDPITPEFLQSEARRAGQLLVQAGVVSDLVVAVRDQHGEVLRDLAGRAVVFLTYRDLASSSPVELILQPR